jgi:hypothetical protein
MKKLKKLTLKKEVIATLNNEKMVGIKGGTAGTNSTVCGNPTTETIGWNTCIACITYGESCGLTCDTPYNHCDFPTINDSCFSFCYDKCNDF